ncbi:MAG TPA: pyridine nucleotide-disulfide oxidoreductase [Firmicutes bacterium]|nr:pyridine nucleotide-disulfide oxidoreductase [Bacillota bacterium]
MKVVIVGGVAGGASAATRLRRLDEHCEIVMFERGEYISYANCGLPYFIGQTIREKDKLVVQTPAAMKAKFKIDIRTWSEVVAIDRTAREVEVLALGSGKRYREKYDKLILAPGAGPIKPDIPGLEAENVFTLRNIPDTYAIKEFVDSRQPRRAVVIGGGFIGVELAENLVERGMKVALVELAGQVIGPIDYEMAALVHRHLKEKGLELYLQEGLKAIAHEQGRSVVLLNSGEEIKTDLVVLGIGVTPENTLAKKAGLALGVRGGIKVDKNLRTSDPDIYAVGDVIEVTDFVSGNAAVIPLAGPANKQGRIAADNICGIETEYDGTQGTAVLKVFDITVASTGNNEKALKRATIPYEKAIIHPMSHASYYPGATQISLKVLFSSADGKILGAQAVGYEGVEKRIDIIATAIRAGMTVENLAELELSYAPPYSSAKDPVNMAGFVGSNMRKGLCRFIHWDEIGGLAKNNSMIIDVRPAVLYNMGSIEGAVNIPVDELRSRLAEIPKDKEIVLVCQVGLNAYLAYRILVQNGYAKVRNLSGGYKTYAAAVEEQGRRNLYNYEALYQQEKPATEENGTSSAGPEFRADVSIDASGLQCPGPIMKVNEAMKELPAGKVLAITVTDPGFSADIAAWCNRTGNELLAVTRSVRQVQAYIKKGGGEAAGKKNAGGNDKTMVVFSGDLDKAIAAFIIANGAAAMGRKVTMFFTFWGLNILRKREHVKVNKGFLGWMFGLMMPRGPEKLGLSRMNLGGLGGKMIRYIMGRKHVASLEELIAQARAQGVHIVACSMSMDVMGIKKEELMDGIDVGGVAVYLNAAETADTNLFI